MKGLYIHIPYCRQKCKYCDFVSYPCMEETADEYIKALEREADEYRGEKIDTIFLGGGTPSLLSPYQTEKICKICFETFNVSNSYEFTSEANPGTLNNDKIRAMLDGGINRLSLGVQSFNDDELKKIGRIHNGKDAYNTICNAEKIGFKNISLDLMTSLPGQTENTLKKTLETAVNLPVKHISAYSLILEDGTILEKEYSKGLITLPNEDDDRKMYEYVVSFFEQNGFNQYEISNFARDGYESRHNIKYWTGEEYIGLGVAAHSYLGDVRFYNTNDVNDYINGSKREVTHLSKEDKISEFMITGLRMKKGISKSDFKTRFGIDLESLYGRELEKFTSLGLMKFDGDRYSLSLDGINVSNSILCEFV